MTTIAVDGRFYGLEHTGLGRYTTNVLAHLPGLLPSHSLQILLRRKYFDTLTFPDNCTKVLADIPHYSLSEQLYLPHLLASQGCSLYYALHFNVPLRLKLPFVVTIHDLIKSHFDSLETTTRTPWVYRLKRWGYQQTVRSAVLRSRAIIVPTNTVKNDLLAAFNVDPTRIHAIAEAPDPVFRSPGKQHKSEIVAGLPPEYFLFVGNAYPHKNLVLLLTAFAQLPSIRLVLVAQPNPFLSRLLARVPAGLQSRLTVLSGLSDAELAQVYRHAQALITPSLMEGYGLPGIEAMMVGTPVIASNIPVYREVYGTRARYFDPQSASSLNSAIRALERSRLSRRPIQFDRTWADVATEIAEVIYASCANL